MNSKKPHAQSCDENAAPILEVLLKLLPAEASVLEIGSGTGQHSVIFGRAMPGLQWQTSDLANTHAGIQMWLDEAQLPNLRPPLELDVSQPHLWPAQRYDAVFSANTAHIMPQESVAQMFQHLPRCLAEEGVFLLYGPFMYNGEHTSESNQRFDLWLRSEEAHRGVRDVTWLQQIAAANGLVLAQDIAMPANNRILVWKKESAH